MVGYPSRATGNEDFEREIAHEDDVDHDLDGVSLHLGVGAFIQTLND